MLAGLGAGIVVLSFASVIIKITDAPSIVIAAGRMVVATLALSPFFWARFDERRAELRTVPLGPMVLAGLLLAAHFAFWIESLNRTSVASSVVLVALNPIFVALLSPLVLREKTSWRIGLAVMLGLVGAAVIAGPALKSPGTFAGNLLALAGAACAGGYLMAGRRVRPRLSLVSYVYVIYGIAAALLVAAALAGSIGSPAHDLGYPKPVPSAPAWFLIVLLGLGPQLLGHTSFNWALKYLSAPTVAMAVLGEPVGTTLLAWGLLKETPRTYEVVGGTVICVAIYLALVDAQQTAELIGAESRSK